MNKKNKYTLGIDIGSTTVKIAILDEENEVVNEDIGFEEEIDIVEVEPKKTSEHDTVKGKPLGSRLKSTMRTTTTETQIDESDKFKPAGDL